MTDIENCDQRKQASIANSVTDTNLVQIAKFSAAALDSSIASINRFTIPRETQESLFQAASAIAEACQKIQHDWVANLSKIQIQLPPIVFTPETRRNLTSITSTLSKTVLPQIRQTSLAISNNSELISSLTQTMSKLRILNEDLSKRLAKSIATTDFSPILKEYEATIKTSDTFTAPPGLDLEQLINTQTLPIDATAGPEAYDVISKEAPGLAASIDVAADNAKTGFLSKITLRNYLAILVFLIVLSTYVISKKDLHILPPEPAIWVEKLIEGAALGLPASLYVAKGDSK